LPRRRSGETERLHVFVGLRPALHLSCFCCSGGLLPPVAVGCCCCAVEIFPRGLRGETRATPLSGLGLPSSCPVSAVAEACFHLSLSGAAAVLRRFSPGDIAERAERLHVLAVLCCCAVEDLPQKHHGCCAGLGIWPSLVRMLFTAFHYSSSNLY